MTEELNAVIRSLHLGPEDHGIFTAFVTLELSDGSTQGFGGYDLRHHNAAFQFVSECLRIAHVEDWTALVGKPIRARRVDRIVVAIGDLLKDKWFVAKQMYDEPHVAVVDGSEVVRT